MLRVNLHAELFQHCATWGLGGALQELERILDEHNGDDVSEAETLRRALSRYVTAYAPTGSTGYTQAWRDSPCDLCSARAATLAEIPPTLRISER